MKLVVYERQALKTLARMPAETAAKIRRKVEQLAANPASQANNIKALKGRAGVFRLRVGDWRVLYRDGVVIAVIRIAPRGSAYERGFHEQASHHQPQWRPARRLAGSGV